MVDEEVTRRLTTIVAADVAGYSRLVGADEEATLAALRAHRNDLIDPKIAEYGGRIANTAGDSLLIEFPSVVEALRCAMDVQRAMAERNRETLKDRRIEFRVGVNIGDVIEQDGDLLGDGVNVAARLEGLADPGGICLSRAARDQVRDRMDVRLEDMGEVEVKNIARPVRVFRVLADGEAPKAPGRKLPKMKPLAAAAVALLIAIAGGGFWWWQSLPGSEPADPAKLAYALPQKPSIAVLPFTNISNDPEQAYFADGMAEDITTDLSKLSGLFVIARNSSFQYRGDNIDVKTVGRELGVKYVLEGSVRRAGDQVRINAQLIDARSGGHLWAARYDGTLADIFKLQDRITAEIVRALSVTLSAGEQALAEQLETSVPEAYDAFLAGWRHIRLRTVEDYRQALPWLNKAVVLDPDYGRAWAALASLYFEAVQRAWNDQLDINPARLPELLDHALQRSSPLAYQVEAEKLMSERRFDEAGAVLDKASALDPNDPDTYVLRSTLVAIQGDTDSAIAMMRTAMRLDPLYPAFNLYRLGALHLRAGDVAKAITFLERARARNPGDWVHLVYLTTAYAEAGRQADAERSAKALAEQRKQLGFPATLSGSFDVWYSLNGAFGIRVRQGLRKAGIPDVARLEDLNLAPELRLTGADMRANLKPGFRNKGRLPNGLWMRDMDPEGNGVHYWQGNRFATSTSEIRGDTQYTKRSNGSEQSCDFYRNPEGTKENLNEFVAVCSNGVFPYAQFRLPDTTQ